MLLPDLLGTYGDHGNALVLAQRLRKRGCYTEIVEVPSDAPVPGGCDIYLLGGGEDIAQTEAVRLLERSAFGGAVDRGAVVFGVCAGLQILGHGTVHADGTHSAGLGMLDVTTYPRTQRAIGEVVADACLEPALADPVLSGFENHRGHTVLGSSATPLAHVKIGVGNGNGTEGAVAGRLIATYLHGPVLARNPCLADHVLALATGSPQAALALQDLPALRRERLAAAAHRRSLVRRVSTALTPQRWLTPGVPGPSSDRW